MADDKCQKYLCFSKDLTLATRLIAFIGISCSVLLITVLINDASTKKFHISRKVALAFGIDWRHLNSKVDHSPQVDPDGKIIMALMIIYSLAFFLTNVSLLLGSILEKPHLAVLWLISELVGCLSKLGALIFHVVTEVNDLNQMFVAGSLMYLLVMFWWWLVVYKAQSTWHKEKQPSLEESTRTGFDSILLDSPQPYRANSFYTSI